jgi:cytochrome c biogenesis protein CcdA
MDLLLGTTLFASFLGGVVALLAPCCVSVMLPAYFASTFRRRTQIVGMTLIFAAGVATIILPIALGASALSALVSGHHTLVFTIGGVGMLALGIAMLLGVKITLPMPAMRGGTGHGLGSVYGLGVFSGAASACCAPVLVGIATISGAAASFPAALAIGIAYVFGMVAPMSALAVVWDRRDWGQSRLLTGRMATWRLRGHAREVPLSAAISGGLLLAMGVLTVILAFRRQSMVTDGWQVRVSAGLTHTASVVRDNLSWVPGPVLSALVVGSLAYLVIRAIRSRRSPALTSEWSAAQEPSNRGAGSDTTSSCCADPTLKNTGSAPCAADVSDAPGAPVSTEDPHAAAAATKESH